MAAVWGSGVRGRNGEALTRGEKDGEELGRDAWVAMASRRWPADLPRRRQHRSAPAAEQAEEQGGGR